LHSFAKALEVCLLLLVHCLPFLGAFAKLRGATVTFVMSVRPSARNSAHTGRIFIKADICLFFGENMSRKFKFHLNQTRRKGALQEGLCTVTAICRLILLRMRNISDKSCRENQNTRGRPQVTIQRMYIACWIPETTNTHSQHVLLTAFPLQQWLYERASLLRYTYIACLVCFQFQSLPFDHSVVCEIPFPRTN
jgi:hypothetical protein